MLSFIPVRQVKYSARLSTNIQRLRQQSVSTVCGGENQKISPCSCPVKPPMYHNALWFFKRYISSVTYVLHFCHCTDLRSVRAVTNVSIKLSLRKPETDAVLDLMENQTNPTEKDFLNQIRNLQQPLNPAATTDAPSPAGVHWLCWRWSQQDRLF